MIIDGIISNLLTDWLKAIWRRRKPARRKRKKAKAFIGPSPYRLGKYKPGGFNAATTDWPWNK